MYFSDLIRPIINDVLKKKCVGKHVEFHDMKNECQDNPYTTILCKDVEFCDDDGDCWIKFTDESGKECFADGQGLDIYLKIEGEKEGN